MFPVASSGTVNVIVSPFLVTDGLATTVGFEYTVIGFEGSDLPISSPAALYAIHVHVLPVSVASGTVVLVQVILPFSALASNFTSLT